MAAAGLDLKLWKKRTSYIDNVFTQLNDPLKRNFDTGLILGKNVIPCVVIVFKGQEFGHRLEPELFDYPETNTETDVLLAYRIGNLQFPDELFDQLAENSYVGFAACAVFRIDWHPPEEDQPRDDDRHHWLTVLSTSEHSLNLKNSQIRRLNKRIMWGPLHSDQERRIVSELIDGQPVLRHREWNLSYLETDLPICIWFHPPRIAALEKAYQEMDREIREDLKLQDGPENLTASIRGRLRNLHHHLHRKVYLQGARILPGTRPEDLDQQLAIVLKEIKQCCQDLIHDTETLRAHVRKNSGRECYLGVHAEDKATDDLRLFYQRYITVLEVYLLEDKCHNKLLEMFPDAIYRIGVDLENYEGNLEAIQAGCDPILSLLNKDDHDMWWFWKESIHRLCGEKRYFLPNPYVSDTWQFALNHPGKELRPPAVGHVTKYGENDAVRTRDSVLIPGDVTFASYVKL